MVAPDTMMGVDEIGSNDKERFASTAGKRVASYSHSRFAFNNNNNNSKRPNLMCKFFTFFGEKEKERESDF